jgi:hypothetical protein
MQLADERGERHVDDRRVEVDHERGEQQRNEDQGLSGHRHLLRAAAGCDGGHDEVLNDLDKKIKLIDKKVK